jgi:hypothetical protein
MTVSGASFSFDAVNWKANHLARWSLCEQEPDFPRITRGLRRTVQARPWYAAMRTPQPVIELVLPDLSSYFAMLARNQRHGCDFLTPKCLAAACNTDLKGVARRSLPAILRATSYRGTRSRGARRRRLRLSKSDSGC